MIFNAVNSLAITRRQTFSQQSLLEDHRSIFYAEITFVLILGGDKIALAASVSSI